MTNLPSESYQVWLNQLKLDIRAAQQRSVLAVNQELIKLYWRIGKDILQRQQDQGWGAKVIEQLATDLRQSFPELKGFSRTNLLYMRSFAENWTDFDQNLIVQQAVGQIPWGHNLVLLTKLNDSQTRLDYARLCIEHGWSRNVLQHQIESGLLRRQGKATTNFNNTLPKAQSELAQALPHDLEDKLPSIEKIERTLQQEFIQSKFD